MSVGVMIKKLREAQGLTRAQLCDSAGISVVFLAKIEQGTRRPSPAVFGQLAEGLGLSPDELSARTALLEVSEAKSDEERTSQMLRMAAIGGPTLFGVGLAAAAAIIGPATIASGLTTLLRGAAQALEEAERRRNDVEAIRQALHSGIDGMTREQLMALAKLIDEAM